MPHFTTCSKCDREFKISLQRLKKNRDNYFCSKKCEGEYRRDVCKTKIEALCVICNKEIKLKRSEFERRNINKEITCSQKCKGLLRSKKYLGRSNPNTKYNLDDNFFKEIDLEEKAYILGWIASDGSIHSNGVIAIEIKNIDKKILEKMRDVVCKDLPVIDDDCEKGDHSILRFCSKTMAKDVCGWLGIETGKKDTKIKMPNMEDNLKWHFLRGFFDGDGSVRKKIKGRYVDCSIATGSDYLRNSIEKLCSIKCNNNKKYKSISWSGKNAMLFLDKLYFSATIFMERKHNIYLSWK